MSAADRKAQKEAYLAKIQAAKAQKEASAMQPAQQREGHEGGPSMNRQNSGIDHDNKNEMAGRNNKWEIQKKQFESQSQARSPGQRQVGGGGGGRASPAPAPALASALSAEERSREMRLALGKAPAMSVAAPVQLPTGGGKGGVDLRHWQREGYASEFDYAQAVGALDDRNSGPGGGGRGEQPQVFKQPLPPAAAPPMQSSPTSPSRGHRGVPLPHRTTNQPAMQPSPQSVSDAPPVQSNYAASPSTLSASPGSMAKQTQQIEYAKLLQEQQQQPGNGRGNAALRFSIEPGVGINGIGDEQRLAQDRARQRAAQDAYAGALSDDMLMWQKNSQNGQTGHGYAAPSQNLYQYQVQQQPQQQQYQYQLPQQQMQAQYQQQQPQPQFQQQQQHVPQVFPSGQDLYARQNLHPQVGSHALMGVGDYEAHERAGKKAKQEMYAKALRDQQAMRQQQQQQQQMGVQGQRRNAVPVSTSPNTAVNGGRGDGGGGAEWVMGPMGMPVRRTLEVGNRGVQREFNQNHKISTSAASASAAATFVSPVALPTLMQGQEQGQRGREHAQFVSLGQAQLLAAQRAAIPTTLADVPDEREVQRRLHAARQQEALQKQMEDNKARQERVRQEQEREDALLVDRLARERAEIQKAWEEERKEQQKIEAAAAQAALEAQIIQRAADKAAKEAAMAQEEKRQEERLAREQEERRLRELEELRLEQEAIKQREEEEERRQAWIREEHEIERERLAYNARRVVEDELQEKQDRELKQKQYEWDRMQEAKFLEEETEKEKARLSEQKQQSLARLQSQGQVQSQAQLRSSSPITSPERPRSRALSPSPSEKYFAVEQAHAYAKTLALEAEKGRLQRDEGRYVRETRQDELVMRLRKEAEEAQREAAAAKVELLKLRRALIAKRQGQEGPMGEGKGSPSLADRWGGIGANRGRESEEYVIEPPTEEQQWVWDAQESGRLERQAQERSEEQRYTANQQQQVLQAQQNSSSRAHQLERAKQAVLRKQQAFKQQAQALGLDYPSAPGSEVQSRASSRGVGGQEHYGDALLMGGPLADIIYANAPQSRYDDDDKERKIEAKGAEVKMPTLQLDLAGVRGYPYGYPAEVALSGSAEASAAAALASKGNGDELASLRLQHTLQTDSRFVFPDGHTRNDGSFGRTAFRPPSGSGGGMSGLGAGAGTGLSVHVSPVSASILPPSRYPQKQSPRRGGVQADTGANTDTARERESFFGPEHVAASRYGDVGDVDVGRRGRERGGLSSRSHGSLSDSDGEDEEAGGIDSPSPTAREDVYKPSISSSSSPLRGNGGSLASLSNTPREEKEMQIHVDRLMRRSQKKWEVLSRFDAERESVEALTLLINDLHDADEGSGRDQVQGQEKENKRDARQDTDTGRSYTGRAAGRDTSRTDASQDSARPPVDTPAVTRALQEYSDNWDKGAHVGGEWVPHAHRSLYDRLKEKEEREKAAAATVSESAPVSARAAAGTETLASSRPQVWRERGPGADSSDDEDDQANLAAERAKLRRKEKEKDVARGGSGGESQLARNGRNVVGGKIRGGTGRGEGREGHTFDNGGEVLSTTVYLSEYGF